MEAIKFLEDIRDANWDYDDEADTLYMSIGQPREPMSLDVGDGAIVRYDENTHEVVGLTFVGLRERFIRQMRKTV